MIFVISYIFIQEMAGHIPVEPGPSAVIWIYILGDYYPLKGIPSGEEFYEKLPFIYVAIPKTGSCSVGCQLYQKSIPSFAHVYSRRYPPKYHRKIRTIARNPYDRAVSAYFFMKKGGFRNNEQYRCLVQIYPTFEEWVLNGLKEEYLHWSEEYFQMEPTILQAEWLLDDAGNKIVHTDNIGRFENLTADVKRLFDLDMDVHNNATDHLPWQEYYKNPAVAEKIYQLYQKDFELLGYSKEI